MSESARRSEHRRNPKLEDLLGDLTRDLDAESRPVPGRREAPRHPTVLVVGCPRSGTTLCYQWLAATGTFTFPTNFVSRFPTAPWTGERIQRLLTDTKCDHGGELALDLPAARDPFRSRLGKTRGPFAPHEFWYWWRRFLPAGETHFLDEEQLASVDTDRFRRELAAWEEVRDRPLLMKGLILDWNLPWLAEILPDTVFVFVRRDPFFTMQSLLSARRDFSGDEERWYSFRPPTFPAVKDLSAAEQVAAQVHDTESAVRHGLEQIEPDRWLEITYEELCSDPAWLYERLIVKLERRGYRRAGSYDGPVRFPVSAKVTVDAERAAELRSAWEWAENRDCAVTPA
ncbi:MAG: sulfotransferase [bacterium]|nr:sulfotransferase [bacterium]